MPRREAKFTARQQQLMRLIHGLLTDSPQTPGDAHTALRNQYGECESAGSRALVVSMLEILRIRGQARLVREGYVLASDDATAEMIDQAHAEVADPTNMKDHATARHMTVTTRRTNRDRVARSRAGAKGRKTGKQESNLTAAGATAGGTAGGTSGGTSGAGFVDFRAMASVAALGVWIALVTIVVGGLVKLGLDRPLLSIAALVVLIVIAIARTRSPRPGGPGSRSDIRPPVGKTESRAPLLVPRH